MEWGIGVCTSSESGIMVFDQKTDPAPFRCYHLFDRSPSGGQCWVALHSLGLSDLISWTIHKLMTLVASLIAGSTRVLCKVKAPSTLSCEIMQLAINESLADPEHKV